MKIFTVKFTDSVQVRVRAESNKAIGDLVQMLKTGDSFLGHPYEWWAALDDGEHEIYPA